MRVSVTSLILVSVAIFCPTLALKVSTSLIKSVADSVSVVLHMFAISEKKEMIQLTNVS